MPVLIVLDTRHSDFPAVRRQATQTGPLVSPRTYSYGRPGLCVQLDCMIGRAALAPRCAVLSWSSRRATHNTRPTQLSAANPRSSETRRRVRATPSTSLLLIVECRCPSLPPGVAVQTPFLSFEAWMKCLSH